MYNQQRIDFLYYHCDLKQQKINSHYHKQQLLEVLLDLAAIAADRKGEYLHTLNFLVQL